MLLDALARQVHASLENRSLLEQALEKEKIERDLALRRRSSGRYPPEVAPGR